MKYPYDPAKLASYWKTPFRQHYSETLWQCIKSTFWCHVGMKIDMVIRPRRYDFLKQFPLALLILAIISLSGCSISGNLTTTNTSPAAITSTTGIGIGATVSSSNTMTGTTVSSIAGTNLTLSLPATATGTVSATFKNTLAFTLQNTQNEVVTYTEDAGVALETDLPKLEADAGNAVTIANDVQALLEAWGLESADSKEATAEATITADVQKGAADASLLQTTVAGLTTGTAGN